ncbi:hypothetical protein [Maribacter polysaccharolyticus]|uniref:hypothetical protein n=1 Tax=Maribacter polysaccharolyticus TaxID=3020831 RepID=UPI00237FAFB3|nr:hypothetical protein [Maribacter polysaccharolyticus]MDE3742030.1 hypothetical protein [Maribacter polysaccharolyticus]
MKISIDRSINVISIVAMTYFAIPKLLGMPQSIAGFEQFEKAIHVDADFFRMVTGISELGLAALLLVFAIGKHRIIGKMAFSMLLMVMLTALGMEFFARPKPVPMLVAIALVLSFFSVYRLQSIKSNPKIAQV